MGRVGSAATVPSRQSRGPEVSNPAAACRPPCSRGRGAPSGLGKQLRREERRRSAREGGARPSHTTPARPTPPPLGPRTSGREGVSTLSQPRDGVRSPSSRGLKVEFTDSWEGKPKVTWAKPGTRPQGEGHRSPEVSGNRPGEPRVGQPRAESRAPSAPRRAPPPAPTLRLSSARPGTSARPPRPVPGLTDQGGIHTHTLRPHARPRCLSRQKPD